MLSIVVERRSIRAAVVGDAYRSQCVVTPLNVEIASNGARYARPHLQGKRHNYSMLFALVLLAPSFFFFVFVDFIVFVLAESSV
jgi:hypothetical protein